MKNTSFVEQWAHVDQPKNKPDSRPTTSKPLQPGTDVPYGKEALEVAVQKILEAPDGQKRFTLLKMSKLIGGYIAGGMLDEEPAFDALKDAIDARDCGDYEAAYKAIREGIEYGKEEPIDAEQIKLERKAYAEANGAGRQTPASQVSDEKVRSLAKEGEMGMAQLIMHLYAGKVRYDHTAKAWKIYQQGVYVEDCTKQFRKEAIPALRKLLLDVSGRLDETIREKMEQYTGELSKEMLGKMKREIEPMEAARNNMRSLASELNKRSKIENVLELSTSFLPAVATDFDKSPYLFNLLNGTYNFRAGALQEHNPEDLLSKQAALNFDSGAQCPTWIAFLSMVFVDRQDLVKFIQRAVGYTLTGLSDVQSVFFCYGSGANGKSTFFAVLKMLLGPYYQTTPIETLLSKQKDSTTEYQLAMLKGARCLVASEIPEGRKMNESQVKDLTGGEPINARIPYGLPFSFMPSHTLWLFGNHRPVIKGTDNGIWRRMQLIPFEHSIPKEKQRPMGQVLADFEQELPGIFNWAVAGYRDYVLHGLQAPEAVTSATKEYQEDSDVLAGFFEECCDVNPAIPSLSTTSRELFAAYCKWCESENEPPAFKNNRQMNTNLRERGYTVKSGNGNVTTVIGIALKTSQAKRFSERDD